MTNGKNHSSRNFPGQTDHPWRYFTFSFLSVRIEIALPICTTFPFQPKFRAQTCVIHIKQSLRKLINQWNCSSSAEWKIPFLLIWKTSRISNRKICLNIKRSGSWFKVKIVVLVWHNTKESMSLISTNSADISVLWWTIQLTLYSNKVTVFYLLKKVWLFRLILVRKTAAFEVGKKFKQMKFVVY